LSTLCGPQPFPVDVSGSLSGDVVVRIQAPPERLDEVDGIVREHHGRVEGPDGVRGS
jgi:hypothetical protein